MSLNGHIRRHKKTINAEEDIAPANPKAACPQALALCRYGSPASGNYPGASCRASVGRKSKNVLDIDEKREVIQAKASESGKIPHRPGRESRGLVAQ
jgi:hypothetical protein